MKKIFLLCLLIVSAGSAWSFGSPEKEALDGTVVRKEYRGFRGEIDGQPTLFFLVFEDISSRVEMTVFDWRGEPAYDFDSISFSFAEGEEAVSGTVPAGEGKTILFSGKADPFWRTLIVYEYRFSTSIKDRRFEYSCRIPYFPTDKAEAAVKMTEAVTGNSALAAAGPYIGGDAVRKYMAESIAPKLSQWQKAAENPNGSYHYEMHSHIRFLYADRNLISLQTAVYEYTGGAHGMSAVSGFVFERASGKQITGLDWLNDSDPEFVKAVRTKLISEPSTLTEDSFYDYDKLGFDPECRWAITEKGILFVWAQYQLGPYSTGMPEVLFSFEEIRPYIKKKVFPGDLFR